MLGSSKSDSVKINSRSSAGYSMRPGGSSGWIEGAPRGAAATSWEIRLGKLQVSVWLGLALGAVVGGYFIGFFSGRYVGFESARQISSGEIAKLPVPESFSRALAYNPKGVYDRLNKPAVLREGNGPRASVRVPSEIEPSSRAKRADGNRDILLNPRGNDARNSVKTANTASNKQDPLGSAHEEISDGLFDEPVGGDRIIIGSDDGAVIGGSNAIPNTVRIIGQDTSASENNGAEGRGNQRDDVSAEELLDARIQNARAVAGKAAIPDARESVIDGIKEPVVKTPKSNSNGSEKVSGSLVRKVLPVGYFAQVSAPKKVTEAESVAKKLKRSGFPVVIEAATVNGQSFYRVLVGPEDNKVQAERLVSQLQSESYVTSKPFIRKVK